MTIPLIERFRERLPVSPATPVVSLGEGSTPLLRADRLARAAGLRELWLKWEASNPTGSYKDRGMTVAVSKALEAGAEAVICASTGNTAASAAAYATRAGLPALVLTPQGAVSGAKLAQTRMLGATVLEVRGDFDAALGAAQELGSRGTHVLVNSLNPDRRAGQKTAVFEILDELGGPPDAFVLPYGGGGNTSSYAQALSELGLEVPIVSAEAVDRRNTMATAIRIGDPVHAASVRSAGARVVVVDDAEIVDAWSTARRRGGPLLRAVVRSGPRCSAPRRRRGRAPRRDHHRPRPEGPGGRRPLRAAPRRRRGGPRRDRRRLAARDGRTSDAVIVRAPATSANLGPAFDCAAVALELWNEVEVTDGEGVVVEGEGAGELAADETNLAVRAYALLADPAGKRFRFTNRIPLERGLGSSAAAIALGLAAAQPGRRPRGAARDRDRAREPRGQPRRGARGRRHAHLGGPHRPPRGDAAARAGRARPARAHLDRGVPPLAALDGRARRRRGERGARRAARRRGRRG